MAIELTHGDLQKLKARLEESLRASEDAHQRLMAAFQAKDPAITPAAITATMQRWLQEDDKPGGALIDLATVASANYQQEHVMAERWLQNLGGTPPQRQAVIEAPRAVAALWQAIAALAVALNGEPLLLGYRADFRSEDAQAAAARRHNQRGGYREKKDQARAEWASGKYPSRAKCAEAIHRRLGLTKEVVQRYLNGTPDPGPRA